MDSDYKGIVYLRNVQYSPEYPMLKVDIDLLLMDHTEGYLEILESIEGTNDFQFYVDKIEPMVTGFARIIQHSKEHGVEKIQEGEFIKGRQVNVGRLHARERTIPQSFYADVQHYTGWFATESLNGKGIAISDITTHWGAIDEVEGFPNKGEDIADESLWSDNFIKDWFFPDNLRSNRLRWYKYPWFGQWWHDFNDDLYRREARNWFWTGQFWWYDWDKVLETPDSS